MSLKDLAKSFPDPIKQGLRYLYGTIPPSIRYGKVFWETYNFLKESQWWSREKLQDYQMQQLEKLLRHSYENVPYYRRVLDERGLRPKDIQDFDDWKKLPYLDKDNFRLHFHELVARNIKLKNLPMSRTSGTTGKPLQFYENPSTSQKELAFIYHQWSRVGLEPNDRLIQLRGAMINGNRPVEHDPIRKVLRLSPRLDNKKIIRYYLENIRRFRAKFLHGYPSTIAIFASMIKQYDFRVPFKLKAVLFASETVYSWERKITKEVFDCRVFSHYGMAEKAVLAGECENTHYYHCLPQYGMTEVDTDTNEVIGTSFLNYVNPFIRYCTTDIASQIIHSKCGECNRNYFPVFPSVEGRLEDFLITPEGIHVSPAVITMPFKDLKMIKDTQIIQESLDYIKLRIASWGNCSSKVLEDELHQLCQGLQNILGPQMKIETEIVQSIQLSKSGKFKWIISEVSKDSFEKGLREV